MCEEALIYDKRDEFDFDIENFQLLVMAMSLAVPLMVSLYTADNHLIAKPAVKQRHPGDEFPVSQRGSTKGKQSTNARV